jgi:hypothetical protein
MLRFITHYITAKLVTYLVVNRVLKSIIIHVIRRNCHSSVPGCLLKYMVVNIGRYS